LESCADFKEENSNDETELALDLAGCCSILACVVYGFTTQG
jgi:hypothetical protein